MAIRLVTATPVDAAQPLLASPPLTVLPDEAERLHRFGNTVRLLATSADTGGAWSLIDYWAAPRFAGPPLHWHAETLEAFFVLEGVLEIWLGEKVRAPAGTFVFVPPGVLHTCANPEDAPARFLALLSPDGFEVYFTELEALVAASPTWPPGGRKHADRAHCPLRPARTAPAGGRNVARSSSAALRAAGRGPGPLGRRRHLHL